MRVSSIFLLFLAFASTAQTNFPFIAHHNDDVNCLSFSPDNSFIVSGGWDSKLIVYSNDSAYEIHQELKDFSGAVNDIAFSRDGYKMIAGGQEGTLAIYGFNDLSSWDIIGLDTFLDINHSQINKLVYGPGMRTIFSAGDNGQFMTFDLTKKKVLKLETKRPISAAAVSVDRRSYYISNEGNPEIIQYDVFGKQMQTFSGHLNDITDLLVTPNRKYLISSSKDRTIKIWNVANGKLERTILEHTWAVTDIDMDPYGKVLVSCGLDGTIGMYDIETGNLLLQESLPRHKCNAVALSPDLTKIAVATHFDAQEGNTGFYVLPTPLKARKVRLPKRYFADKEEEELYNSIYLEDVEEIELKETKKDTKAGSKTDVKSSKNVPVKSKKATIIKKTEQVEIKIED
jgi:WD40 repeat protein